MTISIPPVTPQSALSGTVQAVQPVVPAAAVQTRADAPVQDSAQPRAPASISIRQSDTGRYVYEFRDATSGEILRQFPSESLVALAEAAASGLLLDSKI